MKRKTCDRLFGDNLQSATPRMLGTLLLGCLLGGTLAWLCLGL